VDPDPTNTQYGIKGGGIAFDLGIGGTVGKGVVIGGEYMFQQAVKPTFTVNGNSFSSAGDVNANFGVLGPFIDWYPDPEGGLHVGGMLGIAILDLQNTNDSSTSAADSGVGGGLSVGYDWFVAPEWSIGVLGKFWGGTVRHDASSSSSGIQSGTEKWNVSAF